MEDFCGRSWSGVAIVKCVPYPDSLLVVLHFVHLKNDIVEWIVSFAVSTFQVSLSVFPHVSQTTWIVGRSLSITSWLSSITAISATFPSFKFTFLFGSLCSIVFWNLHFGHLSMTGPFFAVWSIDPHFGQKSIFNQSFFFLFILFCVGVKIIHLWFQTKYSQYQQFI